MSSFPNDPFLVYKRLGTKSDPFYLYNEPKQVFNGKVILTELPDKSQHVTVTDGTNTYAEVTSQASLSANNVYYVDYDRGIVYFDSSKDGLQFTFGYQGIGGSYVPASRVWTQSANGTVTQDVQDMIDNYNQLNGTDLYNLFDPQTGHKHTGGAGDAPPIDSQYVTYNNGQGTVSKVKDTLDSHGAQLTNNSTTISNLQSTKSDITYVDTKVASVASGSPKGIYSSLSALQSAFPSGNSNIYLVTADGKWYYWNSTTWTAGGVYQSTGIASNSITQDNLNFVPVVGTKSKNLFNKATVTTGKYVDYTSGGLPSNSSYDASDYIPVSPSTSYYKNNTQQYAYYDVNKTYISGSPSGNALTAPSNAYYVRLTLLTSELNTLQLELGTQATSYQSYGNYVDPNTVADSSLTTRMMSFFDNVVLSNNLFDKTAITTGKYVSYTNGTLVNLSGYNASDYIPVVAGATYIRSFGEQYAYYDSNKLYVSGVTGNSNASFVIPTGVTYARFSIQDSQLSTFQLNKCNVFLSYDTYLKAYRINHDNLYRTTDGTKTVFIVDQAGYGHYKKINDAVLDIKSKGYTQKITLYIMPGTYEEIVSLHGNTNISIVGVNKKDCILIDKSGDYANCPLQISGEGYISNMTIIANHDNNTTLTGITTYSYAVHHDYDGAGTTVFDNCRFESYQNAAVGIGMHQSQTLKFRHCEFYKDGANYDGGSLYFHNNTSSGVTDQRLILENCDIRSIQGRSVSITDANIGHGDGLGNDMIVDFINTMAFSEETGKNSLYIGNSPTVTGGICGSIVLSSKSYGNNIAGLNAP